MIYLDPLFHTLRTKGWRHDHACHLFTDPGPLDGLHAFAAALSIKRCWFESPRGGMPHYDLNPARRLQALAAGAVEIDRFVTRDLIRAWRQHRSSPKTELSI